MSVLQGAYDLGEQDFYTAATDIKILSAGASTHALEILFAGEDQPQHFSWFWVRDHGIDMPSLDQTSLQRMTDTFSIDPAAAAQSVQFDPAQQLVHIGWEDGHITTLSTFLLAGVTGRTPERHRLAPQKQRVLWDKDSPLRELPAVFYDDVVSSDDALQEWLENIAVYGLSMVENVPPSIAATKILAERIGEAQQTIFGGMWPLSSNLVDHGDTAYTTQYLAPHTDGTYYHDAAGLQMFNCLEFDGKGGESIQVDGFAIAERIKRDDPDAYKTLTEIFVPGHYIEPDVHLRAERPPFQLDSKGQLIQVSFNNYDRAPFLLNDEDHKRFHHAYGLFHKHSVDQDNWLKIPLTPGRTLIFDNWRNLHGRMGYVGKREFYGCYHSKDLFESKLRILQARG